MFPARYYAPTFYALRYFPKVGAELSGDVLAAGDLTTALDGWLDGVAPDLNTSIRDRLAVHYSAAADSDVTTLLARFLRRMDVWLAAILGWWWWR